MQGLLLGNELTQAPQQGLRAAIQQVVEGLMGIQSMLLRQSGADRLQQLPGAQRQHAGEQAGIGLEQRGQQQHGLLDHHAAARIGTAVLAQASEQVGIAQGLDDDGLTFVQAAHRHLHLPHHDLRHGVLEGFVVHVQDTGRSPHNAPQALVSGACVDGLGQFAHAAAAQRRGVRAGALPQQAQALNLLVGIAAVGQRGLQGLDLGAGQGGEARRAQGACGRLFPTQRGGDFGSHRHQGVGFAWQGGQPIQFT